MTSGADTARRGGWYHGWTVVGVCIFAAMAANALPINAFSLFLKDWSVELHTPMKDLFLCLLVMGVACAVVAPLVGMCADRLPARLLFGAGLAGLAVLYFGISFATATWQIVALYAVVLPVTVSLTTSVPANALVSRWFVKRVGLAIGLASLGIPMAGVVMPTIVGLAEPVLGWRTIWRFGGAAICVLLAVALWALRDRPDERDGFDYVSQDGLGGARALHGGAGAGVRWGQIVRSRNFWLLVPTFLPMLALYAVVTQHMTPLAASHGFSQQTSGFMLSACYTAQMFAMLGGGAISDRFGSRLPLFGLASLAALGGVLAAFSQGVLELGVAAALMGLAGAFWPLLAAAIDREFGAAGMGRAFGLLTLFLPVTAPVPLLVAQAELATGSYTPVLLVLSAICFGGGLVALLMCEKGRAAPAEGALATSDLATAAGE